jgi:hypothetical protein
MQPGKFTELFFLDEATAFAAGHRPCALCRTRGLQPASSSSPARAARTSSTSACMRTAGRRQADAAQRAGRGAAGWRVRPSRRRSVARSGQRARALDAGGLYRARARRARPRRSRRHADRGLASDLAAVVPRCTLRATPRTRQNDHAASRPLEMGYP